MRPSTFIWKASASLLFYTTFVSAQQPYIPAPAQPIPTQTWTPAPVCTNGLANHSDPNGLYTDINGALWAIRCTQGSDGAVYDPGQGTNGQGVTACMNGCDNRPSCTAWSFKGTVGSNTTGAGTCHYKYTWGTIYTTDTQWYTSAELIRPSYSKPCPYWNQTTFVDAQNYIWQVYCGYDSTASQQTFTGPFRGAMEVCMTQCNANAGCDGFSYNYGGSENQGTPGACFLKAGSRVSGRSNAVNAAVRIGSVQPGESLTTYSSTSTNLYTGDTTTTTSTTSTTTSTTSTTTTSTTSTTTSTSTTTTTTTTNTDPTTTTTSTTTTTTDPTTTTTSSTTSETTTTTTTTDPTTTTTSTTQTTTTTTSTTPTTTTTTTDPEPTTTTTTTTTPVLTTTTTTTSSPTTTTTTTSSPTTPTTTTNSPTTTTTTTTYPTTTTTTTTLGQTTTTTSTTTTSSPSSSSSSTATTSGCTNAPSPSVPACPGSNGQSFLNACGTNYTVYCGYDTTPGSVRTVNGNTNGLLGCMQECDNYPNCKAATQQGGTCYLKTGFTVTTGGGTAGVNSVVRYIPPNPAYAAPPQAPCQNCSSGCGSALPAGYVPGGSSVNIQNIVAPDGKTRPNILIHIPKYYDPNRASPVIFAFPGNGATASNIEGDTGLNDDGINPYAIAVYVTGFNQGFQSNPDWSNLGVDDVGYINFLLTNVTNQFCVDTGRVFATGHSNGGGFSNMLACDPEMSVKFAAFAFNSGACYTSANSGNPSTIDPVNTPDQPQCAPGRSNVPWLEIHGTSDGTIDYNGGVRRGKLLPTLPRLTTAWALRQGLSSNNYTTNPATGVTQYQFGGEVGQLGIVTHYRLEGWGHFWAKRSGGAPMDATPAIMSFFYRWTDPNRAPAYAPGISSSSSSMSSTSTSTGSSSTVSSSMVSTSISSSSSLSSSSSSSSAVRPTATTSTATTTSSSSSSSSTSPAAGVTTTTTSTGRTTTTTSTSSASSSVSSSASAPTASGYPNAIPARSAKCPDNDRAQIVDDYGIVYTIGCGNDTSNGSLRGFGVQNGFFGCMAACDNAFATDGLYCSSFTFVGGGGRTDGLGSGTCYLKRDTETARFTNGGANLVGAIRNSPKDVMTMDPSTMSGSSTTSAAGSPSTSSSAAGGSPSPSAACGSTYTSPAGAVYNTYCDSDTDQGAFAQETVQSGGFAACAPGCASRPECKAFVFGPYPYGDGGTCFYKPAAGNPVASNRFVAAILVAPSSSSSSNAVVSTTSSPSSVADVPITTSSSTLSSARPTLSVTPIRLADAQCPRDDRAYVTDDYGIVYQVGCSSDTTGGSNRNVQARSSFKDCFALCDNSYTLYGLVCTSFTYTGQSNGVGGGNCYLKNSPSGVTNFQTANDGHVAAIRWSPFDVVTATPVTSTTRTSSSSSSSASMGSMGGSTTTTSSMMSGMSSSSPTQGGATSSSPAGGASSSSMVGDMSSSSMMGGVSSSSTMGGMSSSSPMAGTSSSSMVGGMSSSTMAGMSSSSPMAGGMSSSSTMDSMSSSSPAAGGQTSSMNMMSSSVMGGMSTSSIAGMSSSSPVIASEPDTRTMMPPSSSLMVTTMDNGMVSTISPSPNVPSSSLMVTTIDNGMVSTVSPSPNVPSSSAVVTTMDNGMVSTISYELPDEPTVPAPVSSSAPFTSPTASSSAAEFSASLPTDEPSYPANPSGTPIPASPSDSDASPSSTSSLEACPTDDASQDSSDGGACKDPYGNTFNVTKGTVYTGRITVRAAKPNIASCLVLCDETPGCEAINYIGQECQILTEVTGNYTAPDVDAVAATRAPDATTTYTAPPTSTPMSMPATSAPVSNGSPSTTNGDVGGESTPGSNNGVSGSNPGSSPAASTPVVTGGSTPGNAASTPNGESPGQSTSGAGGQSSQGGGQQPGVSTAGQVSSGSMMPTMPNPNYTPSSSSGISGQTTINGGPGPVDSGANTGIVPGGPSSTGMSISGSYGGENPQTQTNGGSGGNNGSPQPTGSATFSNDGNQNNGGSVRTSATTPASSRPASTGDVCPYYDNSQYTDTRGSTYTVDCNGTYTGNVIARTNSTMMPGKAKRQASYNGSGSGSTLTAGGCMVMCDTINNCIAINFDCAGTCTLLSSVSNTVDGACGFAARRISGGSSGGDPGVSTITVCAARTGTTTVFTTATLTTCAAGSTCPPGGSEARGMLL